MSWLLSFFSSTGNSSLATEDESSNSDLENTENQIDPAELAATRTLRSARSLANRIQASKAFTIEPTWAHLRGLSLEDIELDIRMRAGGFGLLLRSITGSKIHFVRIK